MSDATRIPRLDASRLVIAIEIDAVGALPAVPRVEYPTGRHDEPARLLRFQRPQQLPLFPVNLSDDPPDALPQEPRRRG